MPISSKTKAALIRFIAKKSNSEISLLAFEIGFDGRAAGTNRLDRCRALVRAIEKERLPNDASSLLLELAEQELKSSTVWHLQNDPETIALRQALEIDGYIFQDGHLLPSTPAPVSLHAEISLLEIQLQNAGFQVARTHYQQALDNFIQGNSEAANGQLRSFLEGNVEEM